MLLETIWLSALFLAALALMIMVLLIVVRLAGDVTRTWRTRRRDAILRVLLSWLDGRVTDCALKREICGNHNIAVTLLIEFFELVQGNDQQRLSRLVEDTCLPQYMREIIARGARRERISAAESLIWFDSEETRSVLRRAFRGHDREVGLAAAMSLATLGETLPIRTLLEVQLRPGSDAPRQLEAVLACVAPRQRHDLLALARDETVPVRVRVAAIEALSRTGFFDVIRPLCQLAAISGPLVRASVARALGQFGHPSAEATLRGLLNDPHWRVRADAAEGAQRIRLESASGQLADLLEDSNWWVRLRAAEALASSGRVGIAALQRRAAAHDRPSGRMAALILAERGLA